MKNKLLKYAVLFFIFHAVLQLVFLIVGFTIGMSYFDQGKGSFISRNAIIPFQILSFPLLTLLSDVEFFQKNPTTIPGWIIFPVNSVIWAATFYGIMNWKTSRK